MLSLIVLLVYIPSGQKAMIMELKNKKDSIRRESQMQAALLFFSYLSAEENDPRKHEIYSRLARESQKQLHKHASREHAA
jgi:hypothetical protein